jgi:hypothetical protein
VTQNSLESPLLSLPLELRRKIYKYALDTAEVIIRPPVIRKCDYAKTDFSLYDKPPRFFFQAPPLLSVCRQIENEASAYLDRYINMDLTSTYPLVDWDDDSDDGEITFMRLLTAMRARASRFENVIELDLPQRVANDML